MRINLPEVLREMLPQPPGVHNGEDELQALFLQLWPDQEKNLRSYRAKPGCSCRGLIQQEMVKDLTKLQQLLDALKRLRGKSFSKPEPGVPMDSPLVARQDVAQSFPAAGRQGPPLRHLQGQTRDIADTPAAYAELIKTLQGQGFRYAGLTVRALDNGHVRIYFY